MILDFVIPKGDQGDKGEDGAPGADGKDGVDGKSISEVINYYLATSASSGVTAKPLDGQQRCSPFHLAKVSVEL